MVVKTKAQKMREYKAQLAKTKAAVQKVKDTKYKAQLEKTGKAVKKVKDTKAVVKQVKRVKKAVQKVKDTKYKAQLEKTAKAVQKVKDTKSVLDKAVKKRKDSKSKGKKPPMPVALTKPKEAKSKKLTKKEFIDKLDDDSMAKGVMGLSFSYHDAIVSYRNDYPKVAKTEKQMDKLSDYTHRQVNKQLYDHFKLEGNLKSFNVKNVYGKAF